MPGSIQVSVLEVFDLPATVADGGEVAIKVAVGTREYQTAPSKAIGGKTTPWSLDFVFPVLNLRDNLLVVLLDENGEAISKNEIDTPSIVEQGAFDVDLSLNGGGNVHLSLRFVLTEEERRRIDVMRAAALKRREQEASKLSASMQLVPVEGESENKSSELHSAPVGSLEKEIKKAGAEKESSATTSQESEVLQSNNSEPVPQDTHQESLICVEPGGKLDKVDFTNQDVLDKALHQSVEGSCHSHTNTSDCGGKSDKSTSLGSGNQEPIRITDSTALGNNHQVAADQIGGRTLDIGSSSTINETKSEAQKFGDLEKSHFPQTASEESRELLEEVRDTDVQGTPSSVKAKIIAFEKTRSQGATKQSHILSSSSQTQKCSPGRKTIPHRKIEAWSGAFEAEHTAKEGEILCEITPRRPEDDQLELVGRMENVEPNDRNSEAERTSMDSQNLFLVKVPAQSVDTVGIQAAVAEQPKDDETKTSSMQENRNINLMGRLSKQVLSGAVSGAVIIAAGALLWAANPNRRNSSLQQRSKQRRRSIIPGLDR
eukprot:c17401_g1_i1 orf=545-2176(-)